MRCAELVRYVPLTETQIELSVTELNQPKTP